MSLAYSTSSVLCMVRCSIRTERGKLITPCRQLFPHRNAVSLRLPMRSFTNLISSTCWSTRVFRAPTSLLGGFFIVAPALRSKRVTLTQNGNLEAASTRLVFVPDRVSSAFDLGERQRAYALIIGYSFIVLIIKMRSFDTNSAHSEVRKLQRESSSQPREPNEGVDKSRGCQLAARVPLLVPISPPIALSKIMLDRHQRP